MLLNKGPGDAFGDEKDLVLPETAFDSHLQLKLEFFLSQNLQCPPDYPDKFSQPTHVGRVVSPKGVTPAQG